MFEIKYEIFEDDHVPVEAGGRHVIAIATSV
jgi:hypothetical protein